ncbi:MAG: AAA family ATPase [Deltaproteobacteria bacterium]|jgi:archaellum biogenesis ATPase FlaH|nr:AAA family ATPase [Deltaproteobacteria bacterium]
MLVKDLMPSILKAIGGVTEHPNTTFGFQTGFDDLDKITGGFHDGELVIIASRPGMGKTAITQSIIAQNIVDTEHRPSVLVISLDVSKEIYTRRLLATFSKIEYTKIIRGELKPAEIDQIRISADILNNAPIHIVDRSQISVDKIHDIIKQTKDVSGIDWILIDSLQNFRFEKSNKDERSELDKIVWGLKVLAEEVSTPIVALSSLNRRLERRQCKYPMLADIKGSDIIEDIADKILLLYRDEVYDYDSDSKGIAEVIIEKNISGPTGRISLIFAERSLRFYGFEPIPVPLTNTEPDDPFNVKPCNIFALFDNKDLREELEELTRIESHRITFSKTNSNRINKKGYKIFIIDRKQMGSQAYSEFIMDTKFMKNCATVFIDSLNKITMPNHDLVLSVNPDTNRFIDSIIYLVSGIARYYTHVNAI